MRFRKARAARRRLEREPVRQPGARALGATREAFRAVLDRTGVDASV